MRNILEVARLIRVLESEAYTANEKVAQIKMVRDNGDISSDDALELAIEYFNNGDYKHAQENVETAGGDIVAELTDAVDSIMRKHQKMERIESGDCDPLDAICIDDAIEQLAGLMTRVLDYQKN